MIAIFCLDDNHGLTFNQRRQSKDRELCKRILHMAGSQPVLMNSYTAKQFPSDANIIVREDFLQEASSQDFCFIETDPIPLERAETLIIFYWNRTYPGDEHFNKDPKEFGFFCTASEDFVGFSHEKITMKIYRRI